jgi:hypothetical protein
MEANSNHWGEFFAHWPADVPRRGVMVTSFNEQILFSTFSTSADLLFLERQTPDAIGARSIILPYNAVVAVKIVDVVNVKQFKAVGFDVPSTPGHSSASTKSV